MADKAVCPVAFSSFLSLSPNNQTLMFLFILLAIRATCIVLFVRVACISAWQNTCPF
jgi:hypothetical protein